MPAENLLLTVWDILNPKDRARFHLRHLVLMFLTGAGCLLSGFGLLGSQLVDSFVPVPVLADEIRPEAPDSADAALGTARNLVAAGRYHDALNYYRAIIDSDPTQRAAVGELAALLVAEHRPDQAIAVYREYLRTVADDPELQAALARTLFLQRRYAAAATVLEAITPHTLRQRIRRNISLVVLYGIQENVSGFFAALRRDFTGAVVLAGTGGLITAVSGAIVGFFALVQLTAGHRRRVPEPTGLFADARTVCIILALLPFFLSPLLGAVLYGNGFILFTPIDSLRSPAVRVAMLSQVATSIVVCWFIRSRLRQHALNVGGVLGIRRVAPGRVFREVVGAAAVILLFQALYMVGYGLLHRGPAPQQFISTMIGRSGQSVGVLAETVVFVGVIGPFAEEVIFRGFLFPVFRQRCGFRWGAVFSGALFAAFHGELFFFVPLWVMGIIFAAVRHRTGSVVPVIMLHCGWNIAACAAVLSVR